MMKDLLDKKSSSESEILDEIAEMLAELFIRQLDAETNLKGRPIKKENNYERKN
ncbi:MAG: hypothetical protein Q8R26_00255 [bacterium]|nr:hypothetical protein [bacterium]